MYAFLTDSRLGLWGYGTEHPLGFNQFLDGIKRLGTGAMELHAMHLKSIGALCARTLSYESCEFELVDGIQDDSVRRLYNQASEIWTDLHAQLADRCRKLNKREEMEGRIERWKDNMGDDDLSEEMRYHLNLHRDSDTESDDEYEAEAKAEERRLRRLYRERKSKFLRGEMIYCLRSKAVLHNVMCSQLFFILIFPKDYSGQLT